MDRVKPVLSGRAWAVILAAVFLILAGTAFLMRQPVHGAAAARVYRDGVLIREIDLSGVEGTRTVDISEGDEENVLEVRRGSVRMLRANCPDQTCVHLGWLESTSMPIVCLPHRITVQLEAPGHETAFDAVTG